MKFLSQLYFYKSTPGAIIAIVLGTIALIIDAFLLLLLIVDHQPRDWTPTRVQSMVWYFVLAAILISGGALSLRRVEIKRKSDLDAAAEAAAAAARDVEWDIPMGDPRREDSPR